MTDALVNVGTLATTAINIITENPVLMTFFCGGLLGVGFAVIRSAKRTARN